MTPSMLRESDRAVLEFIPHQASNQENKVIVC